MDDKFDDDLRKHIREVFENIEEPSADEGWLLLRDKFPEEQKRRSFGWIWWGAAAGLLLFVAIGLWVYIKNDRPEKYTFKINKSAHSEKLTIVKNDQHKSVQIQAAGTKSAAKAGAGEKPANDRASKSIVKTKNEQKVLLHPQPLLSGAAGSIAAKYRFYHNGKTEQVFSGNNIAGSKPESKLIRENSPGLLYQANAVNTIAAAKNGRGFLLKLNQTEVNATVQNKLSIIDTAQKQTNKPSTPQFAVVRPGAETPVISQPKAPAKSIMSMFNDDNKVIAGKSPEKEKSLDKKVSFGIYAATYFNYAKGSNNQVNAGMGITSDVRLAKHLKLVTGVTIAQNSLNYNTGFPVTSQGGGIFSASTTGIASAPGALSSPSSYNSSTAVPTVKNYDASLVGLEIPLNLKYEFNPQKNDSYFLIGLSSGTFINEVYSYQYNYPAINSPLLQQTQSETSRSSFNGFYVAKTLNAAFGVGLPFGKNSIIIEPFLKYPLQGLGTQQIRFGAGGLNLKFNFQPKQK